MQPLDQLGRNETECMVADLLT